MHSASDRTKNHPTIFRLIRSRAHGQPKRSHALGQHNPGTTHANVKQLEGDVSTQTAPLGGKSYALRQRPNQDTVPPSGRSDHEHMDSRRGLMHSARTTVDATHVNAKELKGDVST